MITLKEDRISTWPTLYREHPDQPVKNRTVYCYNATTGLYDVCVNEDGHKFYRTNCKIVELPTKYHLALEAHFKV